MPKIWLTSDLHFNHNKDFLYEPRGFNNIEEMNKTIIAHFNEVVSPEDTVYVLGDLIMGEDHSIGLKYIEQLNGNLYIAIGNHDTNTKIEEYKTLSNVKDVQFGYRIRYKKWEWLLTHYPTLVANGEDPKPVMNLHGHTHSTERFEFPHCYNVNPEAHNNYPVLIDDIKLEIQENNKIKYIK